ncbi:MAG: hypothetical protein HY996_05915 [Micrococcales bacterium]|nr:hypothetical protein [Micrococcales bacterium]
MSWQLGPHPDDAPRPPAEDGPPPYRHRSVSSQLIRRPRADTREIVVLELLPLSAPILAYAATQVLVPWGTLLAAAAIAATALAGLVVAARDASVLRARGFGEPASALLALLSPILYIAVRGLRCRGVDRDALGPLPWAIGSTVVAALLFAALAGFEGSLDPGLGDLSPLGGLQPGGLLSGVLGG